MNNCQAGHTSHDRIEVKTDVGMMTVYDSSKYMGFKGFCTGQDDVSSTLERIGSWDFPIKSRIEKILYTLGGTRGKTFVDVGSHVGYFSKLAENHGMKVYAYEAESESLELVKQNAPTAKRYEIWFSELTSNEIFDEDFHVDIMKIDIEGSEKHAIRYFWNLIENKRVDHIIMEVSPVFNDMYPLLLRELQGAGFTVCELDGTPFNWDFTFHQTNLWLHL